MLNSRCVEESAKETLRESKVNRDDSGKKEENNNKKKFPLKV